MSLFKRKIQQLSNSDKCPDLLDHLRVEQFDDLFRQLKKFSWFEFSPDGEIVAYKSDDDKFGTGFVVPEALARIKVILASSL